jgi:hypothetical protein
MVLESVPTGRNMQVTFTPESLIAEVHQSAANKGFWPELDTWNGGNEHAFQRHIDLPRRLMLVFTEIAEAWAASAVEHHGHWIKDHAEMDKPEGYRSELADVIIRLADICGGYQAAGFNTREWLPENPTLGSVEYQLTQITARNMPVPIMAGYIIAQACEYDRKGKNAYPILRHGIKTLLHKNEDLFPDIRQKMDYNKTRSNKHGKNY